MAKKVGVILSGSGVYDGSEIHEAVLTLLALDRRGVDVLVCAPRFVAANRKQFRALLARMIENHLIDRARSIARRRAAYAFVEHVVTVVHLDYVG